jgi:hypothetical protein
MEALNSNPVASGRGVHEELSRLHPQDDDDLANVLPDPFSSLVSNYVLRKLIWRSLLKTLETLLLRSMVGGLKLFARWVPLALSMKLKSKLKLFTTCTG